MPTDPDPDNNKRSDLKRNHPSTSLLLPTRAGNLTEKIYHSSKSATSSSQNASSAAENEFSDESSQKTALQLQQSILKDIAAGKPARTPGEQRQRIAAQLMQSHLDDIAAVNARDWGLESPLFQNKASYWEADLPASAASQKLTVAEFVSTMSRITAKYPNYHVQAIDFESNVDEATGRAEIYANVETSGFFEGVTQRNVTLCEYHRIEGVWMHVAHRTMQGMDWNRLPG